LTTEIIRQESPEEREYARYRVEIETRQQRVSQLQADLSVLKLTLGRFELEYHARVGAKFNNLDRLRLAIDEYERRIARLQADPDTDPRDIEEDIQRTFRDQEEQVRANEEAGHRYEEAFTRDQERPPLTPGTATELGRLYRHLAKRHHPDLARTDEERRRRERFMQQVNAAFQERDLEALTALAQEAVSDDPAFAAKSIGEKLVWAIREVARLDEVVAGLLAEQRAVEASNTYGLWRRQEDGEDVLGTLERDLMREIIEKRDQLAALIATYRQLLVRSMA
jgi:hypothetical protein